MDLEDRIKVKYDPCKRAVLSDYVGCIGEFVPLKLDQELFR